MTMSFHEEMIAEFLAALKDKGLGTIAPIIADGKLHRYHVDGDETGTKNGWYVLHVDERPAGTFGRWGGDRHGWSAKTNKKLSPEERRELERKMTEQRRIRDEEEIRAQAAAAERAAHDWAEASPARGEHDYLKKKQVKAHGIRELRGDLIVPMFLSDGSLCSYQRISFAGDKRYLVDGRKKGAFFVVYSRELEAQPPILCVAEGYATAATVFEATGFPVAVVFDCGNLEHVGAELRKKYPAAELLYCADNDQWKPEKGNPGVEHATKAAKATRGRVATPQFQVGTGKPTDFNDLAAREGLDRVKAQVEAARRPAQVTPPVTVAAPSAPKSLRVPIGVEWVYTDGKNRKPTASIENVKALLDFCGIKVAYNVIRKDLEISIPGSSYLIDTARNDKMTLIISLASIAKLPTATVPEFVSYLGGQNPMNPVADWILAKPWDKESRLELFFATVVAVGEEAPGPAGEDAKRLKELLIRRWMISAIAAALEPGGASTGGVLVFQGEQYSGKTAWFKSLVPRELELTADGCILRPDDKDSVYQTVTKWLVELGEVDATFKKSDIAQLKAFLTKDRDMLRRPYARTESEFARRTVFFASVNPKDYLADPTGNRRFWTIPCANIIYKHDLDMQQIWAEFYELYKSGEPWRLTPDEVGLLNRHNKEFESIDPMESRMRDLFNWELKKEHWLPRTATAIANLLGISNPTGKDLKGIGKAVREITGKDGYKSNGKFVFLTPPRNNAE
jgi:putative DNA primase/helicase